MSLGPAEILVVLILALIVFGPKRLPEVGRQVGGALRELRKVQDTVQTEIRSVLDDTVGTVHSGMTSYEPAPHPPVIDAVEPAPEAKQLPAPEADDPEHRGIDGLSGGTFS